MLVKLNLQNSLLFAENTLISIAIKLNDCNKENSEHDRSTEEELVTATLHL